jgi:Xaa-Pro dipeptidase
MTNYQDRISRLQRRLAEADLEGLLCLKPQNSFYCTGFMPGTYSHPVAGIVPTHGEPALVIWANRGPNARENSLARRIYTYGSWGLESGAANWAEAAALALAADGITAGRIGIEAGYLPVGLAEELGAAVPGLTLVDATEIVDACRMRKDPDEIAAMRDACALTDVGMAAAHAAVRPGASEIDVSAAAQRAMLEHWQATYPHRRDFSFGNSEAGVHNSFWCYVLAGDRVRMNSSQPTQRVIQDGELVWVVVIAALDGQHAENERTFAVGAIDAEKTAAFEALLRVHAEGQRLIRPGVGLDDLHAGLMALYDEHGYGAYKPGRIGHGIGLGSHEAPQMGPRDTTVLEENMMMTYEPNLRIPSFGGLQHSDSILISPRGFEFLTTYRRDLIRVPAGTAR